MDKEIPRDAISEEFLKAPGIHHTDGYQLTAKCAAAHSFLPQRRQIYWRVAGQQEAR